MAVTAKSDIPTALTITLDDTTQVSALWQAPRDVKACLVLAHGAGAGMHHAFMSAIADDLARLGVGTLRYQFPYMERGSRRPDPPAVCHATIHAAVEAAARLGPQVPLFAGGKSFGGRMTSQAQASAALPGVHGLLFLGFPLHPPGRPSSARGEHLLQVTLPMLFLQGSRDEFAEPTLLQPLIDRLRPRARLEWVQNADHSFHVPVRSGRNDDQVRGEMLGAAAQWIESVIGADQPGTTTSSVARPSSASRRRARDS